VARFAALAVLALLAAAPGAGASEPFGWFTAARAPAGWRHLALPSGEGVLWFPPSLHVIRHDALSLSVAKRDPDGNYLAYLNATPEEGEQLATWPSFRVKRLRSGTAISAREEGRALDLPFLGGRGSCVIDVYVTRVKHNHYREIACFVRGGSSGSVLVAAAPVSQWNRYEPVLRRAVAAYRVTG
jgi:hypothetical protein